MDKLHENTLDVAESLLNGPSFDGAALRRAVSSAYYSVFQRLSSLCASRLSGQSFGSEEYRHLYRILDHKRVRSVLNRSDIFKDQLGARFEQLQEVRHWADYDIARHPVIAGQDFSTNEARIYVNKAREALHIVNSLDDTAQLKLAVLLIVRER